VASFCAEPGCAGIARAGRFCDVHKTDNFEKRRNAARPENDSWYDRAAWRGPNGVRRFYLRRHPVCEWLLEDGTPCGKPSTDVHHRDSSWKTSGVWLLFMGGLNMTNLQALCHEHHSSITMKENREGGSICRPV
jgi:hypothetical protein